MRRRRLDYKMENCSYTNPVDYTGAPVASSTKAWAFASSTCTTASSTIATSTDIVILPTMSAGDILIATFLLLAFVFAVVSSLARALWPIEIWASRKKRP